MGTDRNSKHSQRSFRKKSKKHRFFSAAGPPRTIWRFPEMGVPSNRWFKRENPIEMDDLGVPPFMETPICIW